MPIATMSTWQLFVKVAVSKGWAWLLHVYKQNAQLFGYRSPVHSRGADCIKKQNVLLLVWTTTVLYWWYASVLLSTQFVFVPICQTLYLQTSVIQCK